MKKLFDYLWLPILADNVCGQISHFTELAIVDTNRVGYNIKGVDRTTIDMVGQYYYEFKTEDAIYILSYRNNDTIDWRNLKYENDVVYKRDLILYRNDGSGGLQHQMLFKQIISSLLRNMIMGHIKVIVAKIIVS